MPTAPDHLRVKFDGPESALAILAARFTCRNGIVRPKAAGTVETSEERDALDYLFLEWDFGSSPEPEPGSDGRQRVGDTRVPHTGSVE